MGGGGLPKNCSMMVDKSKGTGIAAKLWLPPPEDQEIGYASGIGLDNIQQVLEDVRKATPGRSIWIDMESSPQSTQNGNDAVFGLEKCYEIIYSACEVCITEHPAFLS